MASSTAAALDLTSSNDDYSQDSDVEVVVRTPRLAGNKGKTPFICLTGDILRVMQDRLNKNFSQGDPNSTSIETMKSSVGRVVERRVYLLELAGGLDASMEIPNAGEITIKDLLSKVIPIHIPVKITKIKVCQIMTDIWSVLQVVVANVSIRKDASHDLQRYLDLMMRIEATARRAISEADERDKNAKSIKLPGPVMERMYLKGRGTKPQHQFLVCAKCGHPLVDEPPFNKDYYRTNKTLEGEWLNMNRQMQEYLVTKCNPLLDKKGAIITALKNPTYQEEVLICHCWHNFQSPIAGGTVCALKCYASKSKKQYPAGKCPACICSCAFVCTKK